MKIPVTSLTAWREPAAALGLLIFRLHLGVLMVEAGLPKLESFDWFTQQVADLGFTYPSPELWAWLAAWGEFVGGIMLVLGLGTRWAAAQLAFQFFVISFLWYDKPAFFTGMYLQQEMFWGFVLLLATGAGRWLVDAWFSDRSLLPRVHRALFQKSAVVASAALVAGLLAVPAVASGFSNKLRSDLTIEPGKQFLLGGEQCGAFKVVAKNKGTVAVAVKEQLRDGGIVEKSVLKPGQRGVLQFAAGSTVVLLNSTTTKANLDLTVTGDTGNLRMATQPLLTAGKASPAPELKEGDLSNILANWSGTLNYSDYSSQKTVTLNTALRGEMTRPGQFILHFDYEEPNKKHVFGTDTVLVAADGRRVRWDNIDFLIQTKEWLPGQTLRLVLEGQGQDDNRPATIRKALTLSPKTFIVKKEVRYAAATTFLQRNEYRFSR